MLSVGFQYLLTIVALVARFVKLGVAAPGLANDIVKRFDYEPGDTLNRTMCFCTNGANDQQTDINLEAFYPTDEEHQIRYIYEFLYYNHHLDRSMVITATETCLASLHPHTEDDNYYHNACGTWEDRMEDFCGDYVFADLPSSLGVKKNTWRFCYRFRGDGFHTGAFVPHHDHFVFDGGDRELPRKRDWIEPTEVVERTCGGKCEERGMRLFESG
ncbi:MAG: hypothetical protein Q9207_007909, partial [Kuettlingeria erythrocarpa]